ncbi:GNAT family N-acetyltransferase [Dokdonella sp. MW10]|uniref:GNAT family N-acetyltransferase n=1 Tax=Dokdonella sp. MW10 TaxID=2992926 RepID=UPI003F81E1A3
MTDTRPAPTTGPCQVIARTPRLALRELHQGDAGQMLDLLNDADFLRHIGDRGVRSPDDALAYIAAGPVASYAVNGFGLWAVERLEDGAWLGICGLIRRDTLPDVDLGYALLPAYRGMGYAHEAAAAAFAHARDVVGLERLLAIVSPDNAPSRRLLGKLGFTFERLVRLQAGADDTALYGWSRG